jgi:hypothetical protein
LFFFAAVIPVAAATMTPIPLTIGLIILKIREFFSKKAEEKKFPIENGDDVKESESKQKLMINGNGNSCETNGHV